MWVRAGEEVCGEPAEGPQGERDQGGGGEAREGAQGGWSRGYAGLEGSGEQRKRGSYRAVRARAGAGGLRWCAQNALAVLVGPTRGVQRSACEGEAATSALCSLARRSSHSRSLNPLSSMLRLRT